MKVITLKQILSVDESVFLLEEDAIQDFHSYRGKVNAWLKGQADSPFRS